MNHKLSSFLWYFTIILTILLAFIGVPVLATADVPSIAIYNKAIPSDEPLLFASIKTDDNASYMQSWLDEDGRIHINSSKHLESQTILINEQVIKNLKGYNGKEVMLYHVNDAGVKDSSRLVPIQSDGTWTYFYDVKFSEVIIDGYVGTWEVTAYNLSVSDSLNFGQTFNASNVTSLPVNVTDDATKSDPYSNILSLNPVVWLPFDDNIIDMSGNNYIFSPIGNVINDSVKYNNGSHFESYLNNNKTFLTLPCTIIFYVKPNWYGNDGINHVLMEHREESIRNRISLNKHSNNLLRIQVWGNISNGQKFLDYSVDENNLNSNKSTMLMFTINNTGIPREMYIDNIMVDNSVSSLGSWENLNLSNIVLSRLSTNTYYDNFLVYNKILNKTERNNLYYDHLQQLKIKTNSNSTWSTEWNGTADNPIQVPYADGELFSLLNFTVPDSVVQNGITIYDYPSTVQFDAVATVGYTEDITKITEEATAGTYTLNVTHAANNTGEGYINYTTADAVLLDADFWNAAVLTTDNPNASLSTTLPHFNISTGYIAAATEYYYLVEQDYFYPPQNIQTTPSQCCVNITWDAVPNADNYSVYELEDGFPYVTTNPIVDGVKDAIYNYSHEFLIFSPNPVSPGDYETIYPLRTSLGAYFLIESVDNDNKLGDDDAIYYFDLDNDGLTIDDPAWKITNNIVKKYLWDGAIWKVTGVSSAVGASTGGGTLYPIHELFIPITELGANWTNGSTVKVLVKRVDSSLTPDVVRWYPYGNINNTDTALWQEMVLNDPESYTFLNNTTNLWYNATGLTPFTIYHGGVSAWNGSQETSYALFDVITDDIPFYNVSGYIKNQDGNPLPDITVYSCNGFVTEITTTNESGYWIGYAFREGNYTICANHTCYISGSIDIHVTDNMTNQNITLNNVIINNCELMEKLLDIEDIVTPNSTVPTTTQPQNAMPLPLFIAWTLILIGLVCVAYPKRDDDDDFDIGIKNITASFISVILAFTLGKISINGQLVQTFSGMSEINTVVIYTSVIQIGWLGSLFTFIGITMVILTILLLVSEYKDRYGDVEDE